MTYQILPLQKQMYTAALSCVGQSRRGVHSPVSEY